MHWVLVSTLDPEIGRNRIESPGFMERLYEFRTSLAFLLAKEGIPNRSKCLTNCAQCIAVSWDDFTSIPNMWNGCFPLRSFTPIPERNVHFKDREGTEDPKVLPREHVALVGSSGVGNLNLGVSCTDARHVVEFTVVEFTVAVGETWDIRTY